MYLCLPAASYCMIHDNVSSKMNDAIVQADIEGIEALIEQGVDLNKKIGRGYLPLSIALAEAKYSLQRNFSDKEIRVKIVELLLQSGSPVNCKACWDYENTCLYELILTGQVLLIKLLLNYGAEITKEILKIAKYDDEIMNIFDLHQRLIKQVKSNPTKELLNLSINLISHILLS